MKKIFQKPLTRTIISAVIVGTLILFLPGEELISTIYKISFPVFFLVVVIFILCHTISVLKWKMLVNTNNKILTFPIAFRCYFAGLFANLYLPSLVGGDIVRIGLAIRHKNEKEKVILASLIDRFLDLNAVGLLIITGAYFSPSIFSVINNGILFTFYSIILISVLLLLLLIFFPIPNFVPTKISKFLLHIRGIFIELLKNPIRAICGLGLAILIQSIFVCLNMILGKECGIDLPISFWFIIWPLAKLTAMTPISLGGVGVREVALGLMLGQLGVPFAKSVGVGLLWELILFIGGGFGGVFYYISSKKRDLSKISYNQ